jgi:hypothetical protein
MLLGKWCPCNEECDLIKIRKLACAQIIIPNAEGPSKIPVITSAITVGSR